MPRNSGFSRFAGHKDFMLTLTERGVDLDLREVLLYYYYSNYLRDLRVFRGYSGNKVTKIHQY